MLPFERMKKRLITSDLQDATIQLMHNHTARDIAHRFNKRAAASLMRSTITKARAKVESNKHQRKQPDAAVVQAKIVSRDESKRRMKICTCCSTGQHTQQL